MLDRELIATIKYKPTGSIMTVSRASKSISKIKYVKEFIDGGQPVTRIKRYKEVVNYYDITRDGVVTKEFDTRLGLDAYINWLLVDFSDLYKVID